MTALILFLLTVASFLFYGVAGEDKTWLLAPVYLISYTAVAVAFLIRAWCAGRSDERREGGSGKPAAGYCFILFLLWATAMIPHAAVPFESKLAVLFTGAVLGAYMVWGAELTAFKDNRLVLGFLILVVMFLALYGLILHFRYPDSILWTTRYSDHYTGSNRLASTYICPNHFAHLIQMLMPFCLALMFIPQSGVFLRLLCGYSLAVFLPPLFLTESRAGWLGALVAAGITVCLMALRRSKKLFLLLAILVPVCSALVLFGAWRFSETFQRRMTPVVKFMEGQAEEGIGSEARDFRPQTWMDTMDMIREAPLIGFGPGNYRYTYPEHRKRFRGTQIVTGHPHNEYLELIADYGLIGFGLFALAWCYGLIRILTASLRTEEIRHAFIGFAFLGTAAGTMVHSFFDFEMHVFPNAMVFALLAALAAGPLRSAERRARKRASRKAGKALLGGNPDAVGLEPHTGNGGTDQQDPRPSKPGQSLISPKLRLVGAWTQAIIYLLLAVLCIQTMGSSFIRAMADKKADEVAPGSMRQAQHLYELAARMDTSNWRAYKGMADLVYHDRYYTLEMDDKVQLALDEAEWSAQAHARNPKDPEVCLSYGKCLLFLGRASGMGHGAGRMEGEEISHEDGDGRRPETSKFDLQTPDSLQARGLELLHEACSYRPFNDVYWWNLGVELRKLGRYEEALDVFRRARSIRRTQSTEANIKWIERQMAEVGDRMSAVGSQLPRDDQPQTVTQPFRISPDWVVPDPSEAEADPDLMDLFEKMAE